MNDQFQLDSLIKKMAQDHRPELPSPDLIWWRAQILKKQACKDRVERPLVIMRMLAVMVCLAIFLGLGGKIWQEPFPMIVPLAIVAGIFSLVGVAFLFRSPKTKPAKH